jgi:hypothetical protein
MMSFASLLLIGTLGCADAPREPESWIRSGTESELASTLEIASRRYEAPDAPDVWLVGVTHIGDAGYYEALSNLVADVDVVLYESVMPEGARPHSADTDESRRASTRAGLDLLANVAERCPEPPAAVESFVDCVRGLDLRLVGWVRNASVDAWGRSIRYEVDPEDGGLELRSAGSDGRFDTEDDLVAVGGSRPDADAAQPGRNLQAMLADSLGLRFQLESMPYDADAWRVSDMTMHEVEAAFARRGIEFAVIGDMLSGASIPAQLINAMLALIPFGDAISGGAVSDGIKVVLIELLGSPGILNVTDQQFGEGFHEVIVVERNTVPLVDLDRIVDVESDVESVAILYGAAHMPDMAERLLASKHGYRLVESRWDDAIEVDLANSPLTERDRKSIRRSIRLALAQLKRQARLERERNESEAE